MEKRIVPAARDELRASDGDRDAAYEKLGDALAEGALDTPEYSRRLDLVAAAGTLGELRPLTADLPVSRAAADREAAARKAARAEADKREWRKEWGYWAGGALIMTTIWGVDALREGEPDFYWPLLPLAIWAVVLVSYALWSDRKDA